MKRLCRDRIQSQCARQQGFSLIEVLVTFFVLSIGLLGLAALQIKAVQYNQSAYMRSQALAAGNMMMDMIRLNSSKTANLASYNIAYGTTPGIGTTQTSEDLVLWRQFLAGALPAGVGRVDCNGTSRICEVAVRWADRLESDTDNNGCGQNGTDCISMKSRF